VRVLCLPFAVAAGLLAADSDRAQAQMRLVPTVRGALRQFPPGSEIRVYSRQYGLYEGRVLAQTDTNVVLMGPRGEDRVALYDIALIYRRERNTGRVAQGLGIGGLFIGGVVGGVYKSGACDGYDIECNGSFLDGALPGAAIGAVTGALAGAGIGFFVTRWRKVWPVE
jgi:hypothetical protein